MNANINKLNKPNRHSPIILGGLLVLVVLFLSGHETRADAGTRKVKGEKDRKVLEYGILDYSTDEDGGGGSAPAGKVFFAAKDPDYKSYNNKGPAELFYKTKLSYNDVKYIGITNVSGKTVKVKVRFKVKDPLILGVNGPGGEAYAEIPHDRVLKLPVKVFSQDVKPGIYPFAVELLGEGDKTIDNIKGNMFVSAPAPEVELFQISKKGLVYRYELENKGAELANFSLSLKNLPGYAMAPRVEHYLLPAGDKIRVSLYPTSAVNASLQGKLVVETPGGNLSFPVKAGLAPGETSQTISLDPAVYLRRKDWYCTNRPTIYLDYDVPYIETKVAEDLGFTAKFSWLKEKGRAFDSDEDGKKDHWELVERGRTIMSADDYDADGEIDYFRFSDSHRRTLNRAYVKIKGKWNHTNLIEAHLVSSFLPMTDATHLNAHDVKVLLNDKAVFAKKKIIPRGARIIRLHVDQFRTPDFQGISRNRITVTTKHLRNSHYQVSAENTLVLHYSRIKIPVPKKGKGINTDSMDNQIREFEKKIAEEKNETMKTFMQKKLEKAKTYRDELLKKSEELVEKHFKEPVKLSGVQYRGLDLGIYSSELKLKGSSLHGNVRNMGYLSGSYRVSVYRMKGGNPGRPIVAKNFGALPPFARREFVLKVPGHKPRRRNVYRIVVKALRYRKSELVLSNNRAHLVAGPPPSVEELRSEMKSLAKEMGMTQDKTTLVRAAPLPVYGNRSYNLALENTVREIEFSTPADVPGVQKGPRVFFID